MNRSNEIIDYLTNTKNANELIIAPHAPPVVRENGNLSVAINNIYDAQDIIDTMSAFRNRSLAAVATGDNSKSGSFSFGIRSVGRFRVNYLTQRGSPIITITVIPGTIPSLNEICTDQDVIEKATSIVTSGSPGLIAVCGPNMINNAMFAYSLLKHVNSSRRTIIYTIENILTFLMQHENSIVAQCEINTDIESLASGIHNASLINPDIMYIGNLKPENNIPEITTIIENGTLVFVSSVLLSGKEIIEQYGNSISDIISGTFSISSSKKTNNLSVTYNKTFTSIYSTPVATK